MKKSLTEISVHPLTTIYIALSLILGRFSFVFGLFLLDIIHELFHAFGAYILGLKVEKISILPIGCYTKIEDLEYASRKKQLIILLLGPLSFFFTSALIKYAYFKNLISIYGFENFSTINLFIMLFNLLPISPLDGGKITKIILSSFFNEKLSILISSLIGLIFGTIFVIKCLNIGQYVFALFICFYVIKNLIYQRREYFAFLLKRLIKKDFKEYKIRLNNHPVIYRFNNNYYQNGNMLIGESKIISQLLYKQKKNHLN